MGLEAGDVNMEHRGLAVVERSQTAVDRCRQFVGLGHAFTMRAERFRHSRKIPPLALAA